MEKNLLRQIIYDQQEIFAKDNKIIKRDIDYSYHLKGKEIVIITGIRRCGKSTLLKLFSQKISGNNIYINFDDIRMNDFIVENFQHIEEIAHEEFGKVTYFLDEVQNVKLWERWVNNLHLKGHKVFVTGSNSNLLSSEISTYLTGRNKTLRLHPFSFPEYLRLKEINAHYKSTKEKIEVYKGFKEFFELGGFPEVLKNNDIDLSRQYFTDILNKDLINRYNIRDSAELKDLILFIFSNTGALTPYSTLKQVSSIKSLSTIKNYLDYLENVFLIKKINRFDHSIKKQKVSPSKIYVLDNSLLKSVAFNFSKNLGKRLENLVLIELIRRNKNVYYHLEKQECDFVIKDSLKIKDAIQVCVDMSNPNTKKREVRGLQSAMRRYNLKKGIILTMEQEDKIDNISILPVWKWLLT